MSNGVQNQGEIAMQTDKYTKVVLTLIAIGLFLNLAMYLRVTPAGAASDVLEADVVRTKRLEVVNSEGIVVVEASSQIDTGSLTIMNKSGDHVVNANALDVDGGELIIYSSEKHENIAGILVPNRVVTLRVDTNGNGEVGAWNRKGKGRVWRSE